MCVGCAGSGLARCCSASSACHDEGPFVHRAWHARDGRPSGGQGRVGILSEACSSARLGISFFFPKVQFCMLAHMQGQAVKESGGLEMELHQLHEKQKGGLQPARTNIIFATF